MPTTYAGNGTIPSPTSGASRIVPIVAVTTVAGGWQVEATAHGFNTGDTVDIEGTGAIDHTFTITVVDANDFLLNGTSGSGPYSQGAQGYCIDYQVLPAVSLPDNGTDLVDATVAGAVWEAGQNTQPWLYRRLGKYRLYDMYMGSPAAAPTGQPWAPSESSGSGWASIANPTGTTIYPYNGVASTGSAETSLDLLKNGSSTTYGPNIEPGDLIEVVWSLNAYVLGPSAVGRSLLFPYMIPGNGNPAVYAQTSGKILDSLWQSVGSPTTQDVFVPVTLTAIFPAANLLGSSAKCGVALQADRSSTTNCGVSLVGPATIIVKHYRAN
jgi:hypothetical protein